MNIVQNTDCLINKCMMHQHTFLQFVWVLVVELDVNLTNFSKIVLLRKHICSL